MGELVGALVEDLVVNVQGRRWTLDTRWSRDLKLTPGDSPQALEVFRARHERMRLLKILMVEYLRLHAPEVVSEWLLRAVRGARGSARILLCYEHVRSLAEVWYAGAPTVIVEIPRDPEVDRQCVIGYGDQFKVDLAASSPALHIDEIRTSIALEDLDPEPTP